MRYRSSRNHAQLEARTRFDARGTNARTEHARALNLAPFPDAPWSVEELPTLAPGETIPWHFHQAAIRTNEITAPNRLI
jgi:hypothetical protein